jgi:hypothetical protein
MANILILSGILPVSSDAAASALGSQACTRVTLGLHHSSERVVTIVASALQAAGLVLTSGQTVTLDVSSLDQIFVRASGASGLLSWIALAGGRDS